MWAVVGTVARSKVRNPAWGPSVWSLHVLVLAWVFTGYSGFLSQSKDMQVRFIVDSKLPVGVNVTVNGCLSLCVSPVIVLRPVKGVRQPSPNVSCDRLWGNFFYLFDSIVTYKITIDWCIRSPFIIIIFVAIFGIYLTPM